MAWKDGMPDEAADERAGRLELDPSGYDFVDFGCSKGGAMEFARAHLDGRRGLGVDLDPRKVELTRRAGFDAVVGDLTRKAAFSGQVRFTICSHFLEHLPDLERTADCLETAFGLATDFVYVNQPWFDSDESLRGLGFKLFWSDWVGHPNRITSAQLLDIVLGMRAKFHIRHVFWGGRKRIGSSASDAVHSLRSPRDSLRFDPTIHPDKGPEVAFEFPVFEEIVLIACRVPIPRASLIRMARSPVILGELDLP